MKARVALIGDCVTLHTKEGTRAGEALLFQGDLMQVAYKEGSRTKVVHGTLAGFDGTKIMVKKTTDDYRLYLGLTIIIDMPDITHINVYSDDLIKERNNG